ncbi:sugar phosphate isomerase/epimerase [Temperatibacter marinus]|uniref:Sugar phosphate isomerase/epimerase n=1 Tax=Temperatibacter marinus TaxID=1456591 RepID=A0AA52EC70_9PROT|nr:sugar phosphate isomerase/epimerase [Temperatibacter marinus]WND02702.1 sugar phosphate isomerase/epimerase [Temperatibacter marinus]
MKLGFVSAILDDMSFEEVIDFAAKNKFDCVEVMCWPPGDAERKYAGVTHIDVSDFTAEKADYYVQYARSKEVEISSLGYYPNPLCPDEEESQVYVDHLYKLIDASVQMGINMVTTFIGNDWQKTIDENWPRFKKIWGPILDYAYKKDVKIGIENCAMYFTDDEWPNGKNLARSPQIWRRMFKEFPTKNFGLNYDPSHLAWMQMDHLKPLDEFMDRFHHAHAKDVKVDHDRLDEVGTMANPLEYHDPRIPGRGDIDWEEYVAALYAKGFDGYFCIEVEDSDYEESLERRQQAIIESGQHLRQFMK